MSRRDQWKQAAEGVVTSGRMGSTGVDDRENIPDKCCGVCKNFSENAYSSDGRGSCSILKIGSDISAAKPVYVLKGDAPYIAKFNMDSKACTYYSRMELIDTDGSECADPTYRRAQRQMEKVLK